MKANTKNNRAIKETYRFIASLVGPAKAIRFLLGADRSRGLGKSYKE